MTRRRLAVLGGVLAVPAVLAAVYFLAFAAWQAAKPPVMVRYDVVPGGVSFKAWTDGKAWWASELSAPPGGIATLDTHGWQDAPWSWGWATGYSGVLPAGSVVPLAEPGVWHAPAAGEAVPLCVLVEVDGTAGHSPPGTCRRRYSSGWRVTGASAPVSTAGVASRIGSPPAAPRVAKLTL